ncbi:MAG: hypothetical protein Q8Q01_02820 [archaeon]|nr:hypothetical protein [archaeon]
MPAKTPLTAIMEQKPRKTAKKKTAKKSSQHAQRKPEYMVHVPEPMMMRKDLLEALREIIIFMQGYDKFKRVQGEKIALFKKLRSQVRELNSLVDGKMKKLFPKGSLPSIMKQENVTPKLEMPIAVSKPQPAPVQPKQRNELDELEFQLKDIENQLHGLR